MARFVDYLPHPGQFGILPSKNRVKIQRIEGFDSVREKDVDAKVDRAKAVVQDLIKENPGIAIEREDLERFHVSDRRLLYNKPTDRLVNESPHHERHFVADLLHVTFFGEYANGKLPEGQKLNILALQLAAMTHDGFRSQRDVTATTINYQLHGILADENFDATIAKTGLPQPDPEARAKAKEIDRYHDVDSRHIDRRSKDVEFFNMIDKMELVRLFHSEDMPARPYRVPVIKEGMQFLAKRRLHMHEGKTQLFIDIHQKYLIVTEALYQLSMQDMRDQYRDVKDWNKVDQFGAVMRAGEILGMIRNKREETPPESTPAIATRRT